MRSKSWHVTRHYAECGAPYSLAGRADRGRSGTHRPRREGHRREALGQALARRAPGVALDDFEHDRYQAVRTAARLECIEPAPIGRAPEQAAAPAGQGVAAKRRAQFGDQVLRAAIAEIHPFGVHHRFGEAGTMGQMDCFYSTWVTRRADGFGEQGLAALRDLVGELLGRQLAPRVVVVTDHLPTLASGKLDRLAVRNRAEQVRRDGGAWTSD